MHSTLFKTSLAYKFRKTCLVFTQVTLSFVIFCISLSLFNVSNTSTKKLNTITKSLYKVSDNYVGEEETMFFSRSDNVGLLKKLYEWENAQTDFQYLVMNRQSVAAARHNWPDCCKLGSESDEGLCILKSIQVNQRFFQYFDISLSEGELFQDTDYLLDEDVPVLMGSAYRDVCSVGERFDLYYLGRSVPCSVSGFVDESCYINNGEDVEYLNNFILFPSLELTTVDDAYFALKLYLDKTSGYIQTDDDPGNMQNKITEACVGLDLLPYTMEGCNSFYLSMWGLEGKELQKIFLSMLVLVCITTVVCVSLNYGLKIRHLKKIYAVHIANGASRKSVVLSILLEILLLNATAMVLANLCCSFVDMTQSLWSLILAVIAMTVASSLYPLRCFHKLNLAAAIRGKD